MKYNHNRSPIDPVLVPIFFILFAVTAAIVIGFHHNPQPTTTYVPTHHQRPGH